MEKYGTDQEAERGEKWDAVTDRLKKREEERLDRCRKTRELSHENRAENERANHFLAEFELQRQSILLILNSDGGGEADVTDGIADGRRMERGAAELRKLGALAAEAQMFLSSFDRRAINEALEALQELLTAKQKDLVPRGRFTFRNRPKRETNGDHGRPSTKQVVAVVKTTADEPDRRQEDAPVELGFADASSAELSLPSTATTGQDVELRRLRQCRVTVAGNPSTVHVSGLVDCQVRLGPVSTSVFVDDCRGTIFDLACQQLRVHRSADCHFRVQVSSRSIVEDCRQLLFGPPAPAYYEEMGAYYEGSGLLVPVNASDSNWDHVDDFDWLASGTPSPNWSRLIKPGDESDTECIPSESV